MVAHQGLTAEIIEAYSPGLVLFHSRPNGVRVEDNNQQPLLEWATDRGYFYLCEVYWHPDYTIRIYSTSQAPEITRVCASSERANNVLDLEFLLRSNGTIPPWRFWTE